MALNSVILLLSLSTSTVLSRTVTEHGLGCRSTEYACADGSCIPLSSLCDGISDCLSNDDEVTCSIGQSSSLRVKKQVELVPCTADQWQCRDGTCVSIEDRCDGAVDCPDGSDENIDTCWDNVCTPSQFRCQYGGCVEQSAGCDGVVDCADRSDELAARCYNQTIDYQDDLFDLNTILSRSKRQASTCKKNEFGCNDGTCISSYDKCDGITQCPDRSDETFALCRKNKLKIYKKATDNVYKTKQQHLWKARSKALIRIHMPVRCQSNWFRCMYGACVDGTAPCNNIQDCADNSDELLPRCRNENEEVRGNFNCDDGSTIPAYSHCDGVRDCPDGSDETLRACSGKKCSSYLFQCAYGACVDQGSDCNNKKDCDDNSDEWDEVCNRTTTGRPIDPIVPPSGACVLPKYPNHGTYTITNLPNARPGQVINNVVVLTISCRGANYRPLYSSSYCVNGDWNVPLNNIENVCVPHCKVPKDEIVDYNCVLQGTAEGVDVCAEYVPEGTRIRPTCNSNYYLRETTADNVCLGSGNWLYSNPCEPGLPNITTVVIVVKDVVKITISGMNFIINTTPVTESPDYDIDVNDWRMLNPPLDSDTTLVNNDSLNNTVSSVIVTLDDDIALSNSSTSNKTIEFVNAKTKSTDSNNKSDANDSDITGQSDINVGHSIVRSPKRTTKEPYQPLSDTRYVTVSPNAVKDDDDIDLSGFRNAMPSKTTKRPIRDNSFTISNNITNKFVSADSIMTDNDTDLSNWRNRFPNNTSKELNNNNTSTITNNETENTISSVTQNSENDIKISDLKSTILNKPNKNPIIDPNNNFNNNIIPDSTTSSVGSTNKSNKDLDVTNRSYNTTNKIPPYNVSNNTTLAPISSVVSKSDIDNRWKNTILRKPIANSDPKSGENDYSIKSTSKTKGGFAEIYRGKPLFNINIFNSSVVVQNIMMADPNDIP